MTHYERRLPHWDTVDEPLFVTFRLHGSLPANRVFPPERVTTSGQAFVTMDRLFDPATSGPFYLRQDVIAKLIVRALHEGEDRFQRYQRHAFVAMPNHVHLLDLREVGYPARGFHSLVGPIKRLHRSRGKPYSGQDGRPFWQAESYDHLMRSRDEFTRIRRYMEGNPVRAGLAATPEQFPWSSAARAA